MKFYIGSRQFKCQPSRIKALIIRQLTHLVSISQKMHLNMYLIRKRKRFIIISTLTIFGIMCINYGHVPACKPSRLQRYRRITIPMKVTDYQLAADEMLPMCPEVPDNLSKYPFPVYVTNR